MFPSDPEHLALILRAIPEFVIVLDMDGYIRYLNRPEPGYELVEAEGRHVHEFTPSDSVEKFDHHLAAMIRTGDVQQYDVEVAFPGFHAWYRTRMIPLDMGGDERAILMISSNVTELRALEAEVESLRSLLPICAWCGQIRDAGREWKTMERYLQDTAGTQMSHGICPTCHERQFGNLGDAGTPGTPGVPGGPGGPEGTGAGKGRGDVA